MIYSDAIQEVETGEMTSETFSVWQTKRVAELHEEDRRRGGRPWPRWEDCVKRDTRKAGEEEDIRQETEEGGKDYQTRR